MRILFLSKRHYTNKDIIGDRFERLYEIPLQLARCGHDVLGLCLSYRPAEEGEWEHEACPGRLRWRSTSIGAAIAPGIFRHLAEVRRAVREFQPQLLYGASDIPHAVLTAAVAARWRLPYALDLHDNYEAYGQGRIPGAVALLRRSFRDAVLVSCISKPYCDFVRMRYAPRGEVVTIESAITRGTFTPRSRAGGRASFGLPENARIIGTAGNLTRSKGSDELYHAFLQLTKQDERLHLAVAGVIGADLPLPSHPRVHYLGVLPQSRVADLFSALDVGVVCIRDDAFGRYCYPQKVFEMLACGTPVVVAAVGAMTDLFKDYPSVLYCPGDENDLARKIAAQLEQPLRPVVPIKDWEDILRAVEPLLLKLVSSTPLHPLSAAGRPGPR